MLYNIFICVCETQIIHDADNDLSNNSFGFSFAMNNALRVAIAVTVSKVIKQIDFFFFLFDKTAKSNARKC